MTGVLVAGIGNIFFRDDGYGPAVVAAVHAEGPPNGARVIDYGIRGVHLSYDLLDGVDALVLVDAVPATLRGAVEDQPGTVVAMQIGADQLGDGPLDAHGMSPVAVLAGLGAMGGQLPPTWLVGCVPGELDEGIGLSAAVAAAVEPSVQVVRRLVREIVEQAGQPSCALSTSESGR